MIGNLTALHNQLRAQQTNLGQRESERAVIQEKIERLRIADGQMATERQTISQLHLAVQAQALFIRKWQGQRMELHRNYILQDFRNNYRTYKSTANDMHDAIIRKIAQLENEARDIGGVIGGLLNAINNLRAAIRVATN